MLIALQKSRGVAVLGARGCFGYDESLRAFLKAQETGHHERPGKAHRKWLVKSSLAQLGTILAQKGKTYKLSS